MEVAVLGHGSGSAVGFDRCQQGIYHLPGGSLDPRIWFDIQFGDCAPIEGPGPVPASGDGFPAAQVLVGDGPFFLIGPDEIEPLHGPAVFQLEGQEDRRNASAGIAVQRFLGGPGFQELLAGQRFSAYHRERAAILCPVLQGQLLQTQEGFNILRFRQLHSVSAVLIEADGGRFHILRFRSPVLDAKHVKMGQHQACRQHGGEREQPHPVPGAEYPGGTGNEHPGGEPAHRQTTGQGQVRQQTAGGIAEEYYQGHISRSRRGDRSAHHQHRLQRPDGHGVPGAFQSPLPVQQQRDYQQPNANSGPDCLPPPDLGNDAKICRHGDLLALKQIPQGCVVVQFDKRLLDDAHNGGQQRCPIRGRHHTVEHGGIEGIDEPVDHIGSAVQRGVDDGHGEAVAHAEGAEHRDAEEAQVFQIDPREPQQPDLPGVHHAGTHQQRHGQQRRHRGGQEGENQARDNVGQKPALPSQGHGVEGVAHAAVIQVAEQQRRRHRGVDQVDKGHHLDMLGEPIPLGPTVARELVRVQHHHPQQQAQQIQPPHRREPGQVLFEHGLIKEGCL